jgi:hypothetical protein
MNAAHVRTLRIQERKQRSEMSGCHSLVSLCTQIAYYNQDTRNYNSDIEANGTHHDWSLLVCEAHGSLAACNGKHRTRISTRSSVIYMTSNERAKADRDNTFATSSTVSYTGFAYTHYEPTKKHDNTVCLGWNETKLENISTTATITL